MIEGNAADEWESIKSLFLKHDKSGKWYAHVQIFSLLIIYYKLLQMI
jgi:hypothetical protein